MSHSGVTVAGWDFPTFSKDKERVPSKPIEEVSANGHGFFEISAPGETSAVDLQKKPATRLHAVVVVVSLVSIALLHHFIPHSAPFWHSFFQWLYYVPVVYAANYFGVRGSLSVAAFASIGHLPHLLAAWKTSSELTGNRLAEIVVITIVALVTGLLADRSHKWANEVRSATNKLRRAHHELQIRFEQLKRSDRLASVGELSSSMAHEIRNPLSSIRGALGILQQPGIPDDLRSEFLELLSKESGRLEHLLTNLLNFARPRSPDYHSVDIREPLASLMRLVSPTAGQCGIQLRANIPSRLPSLECDPEQLKQVVLNLVLNAVQAMPDGGEIILVAHPIGSRMLIQVRDQGSGVKEEQLTEIFDPFFTTKENGTGIGLSVAQQIIRQHGGTLTAERNKDRGMTFSILLPLQQQEEQTERRMMHEASASVG